MLHLMLNYWTINLFTYISKIKALSHTTCHNFTRPRTVLCCALVLPLSVQNPKEAALGSSTTKYFNKN